MDGLIVEPALLVGASLIGVVGTGETLAARVRLLTGERVNVRDVVGEGAAEVGGGIVDSVETEDDRWVLQGPFGVISVPANPPVEVLDRGPVDPDSDGPDGRCVDAVLAEASATIDVWTEGDGIRLATHLAVAGRIGVQIVDNGLADTDRTATTLFRGDDLVMRAVESAWLFRHGAPTPVVVRVLVAQREGDDTVGGTMSWIDDTGDGTVRVIDRVEHQDDALAVHGTRRTRADVAAELAGYLAEPIPTGVSS